MNDIQPGADAEAATEQETPTRVSAPRRKPQPTPFDHPLSFPALLCALALWFGYDGWFNAETKSVMFNRVMFGICAVAFAWTLQIGLREIRMLRERAAKKAAEAGGEKTDG